MDNSVNIETRLLKLCVLIVDIIIEGTMSQICILGPSFYFILSRKLFFTKFIKYFAIFIIKNEPRHKLKI